MKAKNNNFIKILKKNDNLGRKMAVSIPAAVALSFLYATIFSFSAQDGEQSGSLSLLISEKCVEFINSLSGKNWTEEIMNSMVIYFEHPIRKLAHFAEYACMGVLIYTLLRPWKNRDKKLYLIGTIWVFISAVADEIHQLYVPGRWGSFADVCLDTLGGCFGILICVILEKIYEGRRAKRARK